MLINHSDFSEIGEVRETIKGEQMRKLAGLFSLCSILVLVFILGSFGKADAQTVKETYQLNIDNSVYMEYYMDDTALIKGNGVINRNYWNPCRDAIASSVQEISFESGIQMPETCYSMFAGMSSLESLDLSNVDTSRTLNMTGMFAGCSSLTTLDLSNMDTSNVNSMTEMFEDCFSLTSLDLSGFDVSQIGDMSRMFRNCSSLKELDLSGFDTRNVIYMNSAFADCIALETLNVSSFVTPNLKEMDSLFLNCKSLTLLDVSGFDTSNVTHMKDMFDGCESLTYLDISNFSTYNAEWLGSWFMDCYSLTYLDISGIELNLDKIIMYYGFLGSGMDSLDTIVVPQKEFLANEELPVNVFDSSVPGSFVHIPYYNSSDPTDYNMYTNLRGLSGGIVLKRIIGELEVEQDNKVVKYDGNAHGLDIEVLNTDNYRIKYKNSQTGEYTEDSCTFRDIGEYVVDYKIQGHGYFDYYGTGTVSITERRQEDVSLKLDSYSATVSYPKTTEIAFNIIENTSNGVLSVVSSDKSKATIALNGNKVTVTLLEEGDVTIYVETGATADYKAASTAYQLKINLSEVTYNVICQSSTGQEIGKTEVTKSYGTTYEIAPQAFAGYTAPTSQMVEWDSIDEKDIIFIYEPIIYTITLNPNNGEPIYNREYTVETETFTLDNPKQVGHTFAGWINVSRGTALQTLEIEKGSTGNLSFVANWLVNEYTYNVYLQSSSGIMLNETTVTKKYGSTQEIIPSAVVGYTTPESQIVKWDSTETKNITFVYEPITYTVTIHMNDGTAVINKKYTVETETFSLDTPSREGYTFIGWTKNEEVHPMKSAEVAKGTTGDVSFAANWNENLPEIKDTGDGFDIVFGFVMVLFVIEVFMLLIPISQKLEK